MRRTPRSLEFDFSDKGLETIVAALPSNAPPERVALLPDLLRAWAVTDLREHLSRERRLDVKQRRKRLDDISKMASELLWAVEGLNDHDRFLIACEPQMRSEARSGNPRLALMGLGVRDDEKAGESRRDDALSWLHDLIDALAAPHPEPPPDIRTLGYLVVLDLAAIFELVTCTQPTRRNNAYAVGPRPYGPFWVFVNGVCNSIPGVGSIEQAMKDVRRFYPKPGDDPQSTKSEYSPFAANLQFRHPELWQKLRPIAR